MVAMGGNALLDFFVLKKFKTAYNSLSIAELTMQHALRQPYSSACGPPLYVQSLCNPFGENQRTSVLFPPKKNVLTYHDIIVILICFFLKPNQRCH